MLPLGSASFVTIEDRLLGSDNPAKGEAFP